ncbi:glycosyltransferase family 25 protein [Rhizobium sp. PAMB 3174]
MKIFYINLDSRPDRRTFMEGELAKYGLTAERIEAVSAGEVTSSDDAFHRAIFNFDLLAPAEIGCILSHQKAWQAMLDQGLKQALFLEDDMRLSPLLPAFLREVDASTTAFDIVRVETRCERVRLSRHSTTLSCGVDLRRFFTLQLGLGGYIMTAECARRFLQDRRLFNVPIDHTFFDPLSPIFHEVDTLQVVPGLCAPGGSTREKEGLWRSDIQTDRRSRQERMLTGQRLAAVQGWGTKSFREVLRVARQVVSLGAAARDFLRRPFVSTKIPFWDGGLS